MLRKMSIASDPIDSPIIQHGQVRPADKVLDGKTIGRHASSPKSRKSGFFPLGEIPRGRVMGAAAKLSAKPLRGVKGLGARLAKPELRDHERHVDCTGAELKVEVEIRAAQG